MRRLLLAIPEGKMRLMAGLMYGSELRMMEARQLLMLLGANAIQQDINGQTAV